MQIVLAEMSDSAYKSINQAIHVLGVMRNVVLRRAVRTITDVGMYYCCYYVVPVRRTGVNRILF